jgi:hypothetical protein
MSFRRNRFSILALLMAALLSQNAAAAKFNNKTLKGSYAASIEGVYTFIDKTPVGLPAWFTGVVEADGKGKISSFMGTFNIGACIVVSHDGEGTYSVNENGTGTATVQLRAEPITVPSAECPDEVIRLLALMPPMNTVKFSLAIQNSRTVYGSIVGKTDPTGKAVSFGGKLTAYKQ